MLDKAGGGCGVEKPDLVGGFLLNADDEEARGPEHVGVESGLAVVVVLLGGGQEVGVVGGAGGFEVDQRELAAGGAADE